jgi:hypothetical protein
VIVIDLTWEMVAMSVISRLIGATTKFSAIAKIHKYRRLHEGHHFIPTAMEVHGALEHDMDHFIEECACFFFHNRRSKSHLS